MNKMFRGWDIIDIFKVGVGVIFTVFFICFICGPVINKNLSPRTETATITDKGIKNSKSESRYLIYAKNPNNETRVYEISDSLFKGRFNSSDIYAEIEVGKTYELTVRGKRVPFLSWYPNIYVYK
ncbi:hypothetical protein [Lacrimispora amygdalina]|uniref:hypothetical protein n=1 Tax=Lacrimispora amygdalina TaxID=253257 RepID=UPI000BE246FD|nr:hypothetical protein [Lacrimispora amygdalina]